MACKLSYLTQLSNKGELVKGLWQILCVDLMCSFINKLCSHWLYKSVLFCGFFTFSIKIIMTPDLCLAIFAAFQH